MPLLLLANLIKYIYHLSPSFQIIGSVGCDDMPVAFLEKMGDAMLLKIDFGENSNESMIIKNFAWFFRASPLLSCSSPNSEEILILENLVLEEIHVLEEL